MSRCVESAEGTLNNLLDIGAVLMYKKSAEGHKDNGFLFLYTFTRKPLVLYPVTVVVWPSASLRKRDGWGIRGFLRSTEQQHD